jgi:hypothetical protein
MYYAPFPSGQQSTPMAAKNESWKFPKDFWWGVASAAYQIEGAAKDEGRGPSIWDVLLHRVTGFSTANQTGDVGCNEYYLYKQGELSFGHETCAKMELVLTTGAHRHCSNCSSWSQGLFFFHIVV